VLSVALDVDPARHRPARPSYVIWLRRELDRILDRLPAPARRDAARLARRVLEVVGAGPRRGRGLVIFAAPGLFREYALPVPVPSHVELGRPDLVPMLWALADYPAYGVVAVYRDHAQIFLAYLGRVALVGEERLELNTGSWRFKAGRTDTYTRAVGIGVGRGAQEDPFAARIDAHRRRFWKGVAEAVLRTLRALRVDRVVLGGSEESVTALRDVAPHLVRERVVGTVPIPTHATLEDVRERTLPCVLEDRQREETRLVSDLVQNAEGVVGRIATVAALSSGRLRILAASRDLEGEGGECRRCGYAAPSPDGPCPACGGPVTPRSLRQMLPRLAHRHGTRLELVGPPSSAGLPDGMGGLLRESAP
jgi:hypothetical protein